MIPDINNIDLSGIGLATPKARPQFTVLYGPGKIGKTSAACYSESPVILPIGNESGQEIMIKYGVPCLENTSDMPEINFIFGALAMLMKKDHTRKTVIIDNLSRFREVVDNDVAKDNVGVDLSTFGKAQSLSFPYYKRLIMAIKMLMAKRNMHVILIAHDVNYNVQLENGSYYTKTGILAPAGENTNVRSLIETTAHNVVYLKEEAKVLRTSTPMGQKKQIGLQDEIKRVIHTRSNSAFFAGTYNKLEEKYEIDNTENYEDLYKNKTNETLIKFFKDLYEE
ncbi:MAG: AAA family ATPase [Candidatus Rickettsiella isopodorum]|nr:AAA family ATPase [Candidatus Rickettsiella isopodorum]